MGAHMYLLALVQGWAAGSLVHSGTARRGRQQGQGVQDGVFKGDHSPLEISFTGHLETHMPDHSQGPPVSLSFPRPHQGKPRICCGPSRVREAPGRPQE